MAAMKPDGFPAAWITTTEVARRLGIKPRTVIDMVTKGKLHPRKYLRPGVAGGAISLFDPAEVAEVMQQRAIANTEVQQRAPANTEVMPAGARLPAPRAAVSMVRAIDAAAVPAEGRLAAIVATMPAPPRWLRYDEAVVYTGLGESRLRELVNAGKVATDRGPHGSIVLRRADLDKH